MGGCSSQEPETAKNDEAAGEQDDDCHIMGLDKDDEPKLDPKDFISRKLRSEIVFRSPGALKGQSFTIDNCKDCSFFLFDNTAAVTIDDCSRCTFFVGPCESSVFVRNCRDCKMIVACRQFRTRQCKDMDVMLFCAAGQPIIEMSERIRFGAFNYTYFSLNGQFETAHMHVWDTEWSNVYDFTKGNGEEADSKEEAKNWGFLPVGISPVTLLGMRPHEVCEDIKEEESKLSCPVPPAWGTRPLPPTDGWEWECCFVLVPGDDEDTLHSIREWVDIKESQILIKRSRTRKLSDIEVSNLCRTLGYTGKIQLKGGLYIGVEVIGRECIKRLPQKCGSRTVTSVSPEISKSAAVTFFDALAHI